MRRGIEWWTAPAVLASTVVQAAATPAISSFATAQQVAQRSFPQATGFKESDQTATEDGDHLPTLLALQGQTPVGVVVFDSVVGKFELIDYAVAIDAEGKVCNVEILTYRESHGQEVRLPSWRKQFTGKGPGDRLRVGQDIVNISGATLSSTHVTDGVRRIVSLVARLRRQGQLF